MTTKIMTDTSLQEAKEQLEAVKTQMEAGFLKGSGGQVRGGGVLMPCMAAVAGGTPWSAGDMEACGVGALVMASGVVGF